MRLSSTLHLVTHHLVGTVEIAEMLGVSRQRAHQIAAKPSFPAPVATLASGKVWETEPVKAWIRENRPEPASDSCSGSGAG